MNDRTWYALVLVVAIVINIAFTIAMITATRGLPQDEAVEFVDSTYVPVEGCPGDLVTYYSTMNIIRPVVLEVTSSIMRGHDASGDTVIFGRLPNTALAPIPSERLLTDKDGVTFTLPDIEPGEYARVRAIGTWGEDSKPVQIVQPFTILADCE
jgi:hypothetical protein